MKIALITACYDSGHYRVGFGRGPEAILAKGLIESLRTAGHDITVVNLGEVGDTQGREIATGFAVCRAVAETVRKVRHDGRFPVVLAGNCLTSTGAVAGEDAEAIIWFDQHGDLNTPETSTSGFLDGMALATVLGLCWQPMTAMLPHFKPVDPSRCILVDARDLDPDENKFLSHQPITKIECKELEKTLVDMKTAANSVPSTHLHLDLDIHDPALLRVNRYAMPGGPSPELVRKTVTAAARLTPLSGITISAYDPACDEKGRVPSVVKLLLEDLLAAKEAAY